MRVKLFILLLVIVTLFSFVLHSEKPKVVVQEQSLPIQKLNNEKEPMLPFVMVDQNQFD